MRLKAGENLSAEMVGLLRARRFDVATVQSHVCHPMALVGPKEGRRSSLPPPPQLQHHPLRVQDMLRHGEAGHLNLLSAILDGLGVGVPSPAGDHDDQVPPGPQAFEGPTFGQPVHLDGHAKQVAGRPVAFGLFRDRIVAREDVQRASFEMLPQLEPFLGHLVHELRAGQSAPKMPVSYGRYQWSVRPEYAPVGH
jgi:hypothetical protein